MLHYSPAEGAAGTFSPWLHVKGYVSGSTPLRHPLDCAHSLFFLFQQDDNHLFDQRLIIQGSTAAGRVLSFILSAALVLAAEGSCKASNSTAASRPTTAPVGGLPLTDADHALRRLMAANLPLRVVRPALCLAALIQAALIVDTVTSLVVLLTLSDQERSQEHCRSGPLSLALCLLATSAHALIFCRNYSALWKVDWTTGPATAAAAFPPNSTDTLSRLNSLKTENSNNVAETALPNGATSSAPANAKNGGVARKAVAPFDWSQFPDQSTEESGDEQQAADAAGAGRSRSRKSRKNRGSLSLKLKHVRTAELHHEGGDGDEYEASHAAAADAPNRRSLYAVTFPGEDDGSAPVGVWHRSSARLVTVARRRAVEEEVVDDDGDKMLVEA